MRGGSVLDWLTVRWNTWTSRMILEFFEVIFSSSNIYLWRIVDSLMFTIIAFSLANLFTKFDFKSNLITCLVLLLFPFLILYSAGWISTTIVYCWTGAMGLIALLPLKKVLYNKKITIIDYSISFFSLLIALNQEQMCCLILGFSIVFIYICYKNKIKSNYPVFLFIFSIISLFIIFICPGNSLRTTSEILTWYPKYTNFNLFQKIYLGLISTFSILFSNKILISLYAFGMYYYYKFCNKSNNVFLKYNLIINLIITLAISFPSAILFDSFGTFNSFYDILNMQDIPDFAFKPSNFYLLMPLVFSAIYFINLIYLTYSIFKNNKNYILFPIILIAGLASHFIMGFSPTVFASGERTAFYLFLTLITLILAILNNIRIPKNKVNYFLIIVLILGIFNFLNIMLSMPMIGGIYK